MNARDLARLQEDQNLRSTLRSGKSGIRLLDDGENNVGNSILLQPQALPPPDLFTVVKQQAINGRILNLTASSKTGQSVTVVMTAARSPGITGGIAGPITGVIEFGNGTVSTTIEFDIPVGPYTGNIQATSPGTQPEDSGAVIQVPSGIIRAYARYDNAFITPDLGGFAFGGPGTLSFPPSPAFPLFPGAGPFAPNLANPTPVTVKAFASYFGRHHTKLYKTQYLYIGDATLPQPFAGTYCVPPFAKSVQVVPNPAVSMTLDLTDSIPFGSSAANRITFVERYVIPANTFPVIPIEGNVTTITIRNTVVGSVVCGAKLVYEIGF
jgi:hypothetical protein